MDPNQVEQPAVYVEVVEAGSGTEISSGTEQIVQSEMVIDHGQSLGFVLVYIYSFSYSIYRIMQIISYIVEFYENQLQLGGNL